MIYIFQIIRVGKYWFSHDLPNTEVTRRWMIPTGTPNQVYAYTLKLEEGYYEFKEKGIDVSDMF